MNKKYNNIFVYKEDYYEMYDNNNNMCIIDIDDYSRVSQYYWGKYQSNYFCSCTGGTKQWLHRFIVCAQSGEYVDHKNNDFNDYRKNNLRICNNAENNRNKWLQKNNTSGYPGVSWSKSNQKWRARIKVNKKEIHLGVFDTKEDAIKVRQAAEEKYFKEFSYNNSQQEVSHVC